MKKQKSILKQAEQNVINNAKYCQDILKIVEALEMFSYRYMYDSDIDEAIDALQKFRNTVYKTMNEHLVRCFMFVGVGGEEAEKFSFEQFKEHFGDNRYCVARFLDKAGNLPSCWSSEDEEQLRKEVLEKINEN